MGQAIVSRGGKGAMVVVAGQAVTKEAHDS